LLAIWPQNRKTVLHAFARFCREKRAKAWKVPILTVICGVENPGVLRKRTGKP
jgi:hypothetical protein